MVAQDDDGSVGIEFLVGARGNFVHGDVYGIGQRGRGYLPRFANVHNVRCLTFALQRGKFSDGDLERQHLSSIRNDAKYR